MDFMSQPEFHCVSSVLLRWLLKCGSQSVHSNSHGAASHCFPGHVSVYSHLQSCYDFNTDHMVPVKDLLKIPYISNGPFLMWTHAPTNRQVPTPTYHVASWR